MIRAQGAQGPGLNSPNGPYCPPLTHIRLLLVLTRDIMPAAHSTVHVPALVADYDIVLCALVADASIRGYMAHNNITTGYQVICDKHAELSTVRFQPARGEAPKQGAPEISYDYCFLPCGFHLSRSRSVEDPSRISRSVQIALTHAQSF